jgi:hypothetical protein
MTDDVIKAGGEAVGLDLHACKLRAQGGQALAETFPEMLETSAFEMGRRAGDGGATEPSATAVAPRLNNGSTTSSMA